MGFLPCADLKAELGVDRCEIHDLASVICKAATLLLRFSKSEGNHLPAREKSSSRLLTKLKSISYYVLNTDLGPELSTLPQCIVNVHQKLFVNSPRASMTAYTMAVEVSRKR